MKTILNILALTGTALALCNCAAMTSGSQQSVSVTTAPVNGATCELNNDAGTWYISSTPGSVTVHREASDLTVVCKKAGLTGTTRAISSTKAVAYGNILLGGLVGAAVDRSNGAAFDYPTLIKVPMSKGGSFSTIGDEPKESSDNTPNTRRR